MPADQPQEPDLSLVDTQRELIKRKGLLAFVKRAWPSVVPSEFVPGWHIEEICTHLEAVTRGDCRRIVVNVPPGSSKSSVASVMWPAWDWISHPARRWMVATFDSALANRDAMACRRLVRDGWFAERWGQSVAIDGSGDVQETQGVWSTTGGGRRVSVTVAGRGTGWHGDIQLIDDPTKPKDMVGDPDKARAALERTWAWWTGTMASRRTGSDFARVIIMQRLHESDLVGRILENDTEHEWVHLMLPMRFEPERACKTQWGGDRRTRPYELLCPARWDEAAVKEIERDMGSQVAAAQLQQRPAPAGGNVFRREWFKVRWLHKDNPKWARLSVAEREFYVVLPPQLTEVLSTDCSFKDTAGADYVAMHAWGTTAAKYYLLDRIHDRLGLPETVRCLQALAARRPRARGKLIEDKANGPAVEQMLRDKMAGLIMVEPDGGKIARWNAVTPLCEAGDVILPDESECPWIGEVVEEIVSVPFARNDDDADAMAQALRYLHDRSPEKYIEAMRRVRAGEVKLPNDQ